MNEIIHHLERHSYSLLFACVFVRQAGLPVPAILFLVAAGTLAGNGYLSIAIILCVSVVATVSADLMWYEAGRLHGNDILHFIQRFSCISDDTFIKLKRQFARYGAKTPPHLEAVYRPRCHGAAACRHVWHPPRTLRTI